MINDTTKNKKCIICSQPNNYYGWKYLCQKCYTQCLNETQKLKGKYNSKEYKNLYNHIKNLTLNSTNNNCIKLVAIAKALDRYNNNNSLLNQVEKDIIQIKQNNTLNDQLNCIICGHPSNGKHFCLDCWKKYKDKSIDIRIKNCEETKIIDKHGNLKYRCDDGHIVRSKSEKAIDDFLFKYGILHIYEKSFSIDKNPEHDLHPDFYLPKYNIYIEHFGTTRNSEYEETKDYKISIYKKTNITLICTTEKDMNDLSANLTRKLTKYTNGKINFQNE